MAVDTKRLAAWVCGPAAFERWLLEKWEMGMRLPPETERKALELAAVPARPQSEKDFMAEVFAFARDHSWLAYHTHDSRRSSPGFPDAVFARAPRLFVAELKVVGGKLTPDQERWLEAFRAARIPAFCWTPADWDSIREVLQCP